MPTATTPKTDPNLGTYCGVGNHDKCRLGTKKCACTCHITGLPPDPDPATTPAAATPATGGRPGRASRGDLADTDFAWEDPPPRGAANRNVALVTPLIPELRRHPGRWARLVIFEKASGANSAKTSLAKVTQFSDIEFAARSNPIDKTSTLYGRYTGE